MVKKKIFRSFFGALFVSIIIFIANMFLSNEIATAKKIETNIENTLYLYLKDGRVVIRMLPNIAPRHVTRIKELVRNGFYNGLPFHRVIEDFMAQCGDNGIGGSGKTIPAEFTMKYSHKRGAVSMARADDPNSADSQFFIVLKDSTYLDGQYTIWGYVVEGMEFVDNIKKGDIIDNGIVKNPDTIVKMVLASDTIKKKQ